MEVQATSPELDTYRLLAALPLEITAYTLEPLQQPLSDGRTRRTTVVRLRGQDEEGTGEDVTPTESDQLAFQSAPRALPLAGIWTLDSLSAHIETLDLFPSPPPFHAFRSFRRWAFESAALDLALRQAGRSLADVLGRHARAVTFVNSLRLPNPATTEPIRRRLQLQPGLRFKLDPTPDWSDDLTAEIAATGAVAILDLKGQYPPHTPVAQAADPNLYARLANAFPDAWIEDPTLGPATNRILRLHRDRITWDAPIRTVSDIEALPFHPRALNMKPARIGALRALLEIYDYCERQGIAMYGGGMLELGPGRGQIQYLASLFHPDAPNDTAPVAYNLDDLPADTAPGPLFVNTATTGFLLEGRATETPPSTRRRCEPSPDADAPTRSGAGPAVDVHPGGGTVRSGRR
jgi:L-alanine-DL-glutamate epimerase-like enolase superfamily enzyme